jgi:hypothetical protein
MDYDKKVIKTVIYLVLALSIVVCGILLIFLATFYNDFPIFRFGTIYSGIVGAVVFLCLVWFFFSISSLFKLTKK